MRRFPTLLLSVLVLIACGAISSHPRLSSEAPTLRALLGSPGGTVFIPIPLVRQSHNYTCGAAAMQSLLAYYGEDFREGQLQRLLGSDRELGTSYLPMLAFLQKIMNSPEARKLAYATPACREDKNKASPEYKSDCLDGFAAVEARAADFLTSATTDGMLTVEAHPGTARQPGLTVEGLESLLRAGHPVMVMLQAWSEKPGVDWETDWEDGHFAVAVGFDAESYFFMDPSTVGQWTSIPRAEFLRRWHDEDDHKEPGGVTKILTRHFALTFWKTKSAFNFFDTPLPRME